MLLKIVRRRLVTRVEKKAISAENVLKEDKTPAIIVARMDISHGIVLLRRLQGVGDKLTEEERKVAVQVLAEVKDGEEVMQLDRRVTVTRCEQPTVIDARILPVKAINALDVVNLEMLSVIVSHTVLVMPWKVLLVRRTW